MPAKKKGISTSAKKRPGVAKKTVARKKAVAVAAPPPVQLPVVLGGLAGLSASEQATLPRPLVVSEIFRSIQGEGRWVGVPSTFIRLNGCNLRCVWCDTPYTSWEPKGSEMLMGALLAAVRRCGWGHAVITGGEPMLQSSIGLLTRRLKEDDFVVTIETAGTVFQEVTCDLMSISPKLANSVPHRREGGRWAVRHESLRYQPEIIKQLMAAHDYQLKFVLQQPEDMDEVNKIVNETGADPAKVVLMAEGTDAGTLFERGQWLVNCCKRWGYRFTPRIHIDLWGNKRGV